MAGWISARRLADLLARYGHLGELRAGSALAANTPAPGWLICWLSQRHDHAAVAGEFCPVIARCVIRSPATAMTWALDGAAQDIAGGGPDAGPRGRSFENPHVDNRLAAQS